MLLTARLLFCIEVFMHCYLCNDMGEYLYPVVQQVDIPLGVTIIFADVANYYLVPNKVAGSFHYLFVGVGINIINLSLPDVVQNL